MLIKPIDAIKCHQRDQKPINAIKSRSTRSKSGQHDQNPINNFGDHDQHQINAININDQSHQEAISGPQNNQKDQLPITRSPFLMILRSMRSPKIAADHHDQWWDTVFVSRIRLPARTPNTGFGVCTVCCMHDTYMTCMWLVCGVNVMCMYVTCMWLVCDLYVTHISLVCDPLTSTRCCKKCSHCLLAMFTTCPFQTESAAW